MAHWTASASAWLNRGIEAIVAFLMLVLVLDVWLGVADRYFLGWQLPWPEEFARYVMIWAAMLAVSSGISRREHIGLTALISTIPEGPRRIILIAMDIVAFALFFYVFWYGLGFMQSGASRRAMIFGSSMQPYFAAIPVSAAICCIQVALVTVRDMGRYYEPGFQEEME